MKQKGIDKVLIWYWKSIKLWNWFSRPWKIL